MQNHTKFELDVFRTYPENAIFRCTCPKPLWPVKVTEIGMNEYSLMEVFIKDRLCWQSLNKENKYFDDSHSKWQNQVFLWWPFENWPCSQQLYEQVKTTWGHHHAVFVWNIYTSFIQCTRPCTESTTSIIFHTAVTLKFHLGQQDL